MKGWLLGLHIIAIIVWMGGATVTSRLIGHHAGLDDPKLGKALERFERNSFYVAIFPAFGLALVTGLAMLFTATPQGAAHYLSPSMGAWGATFHVKFALVFLLVGLDHMTFAKMKRLHRTGEGNRRFFQIAHGVMGVAFMAIVILVKTRILA